MPAAGYGHEDSKALRGDKFCGCPLDQVNEGDKTEARLSEWLDQRYRRIEPAHIPKPGTAKYKKMMIPIFKPDEVSQPLRQSLLTILG